MKNRKGFVSNSSSSSFIIAIKKDVSKCEHCGRSDIDLLQLIDYASDYESSVEEVGAEGVIHEIKNEWYDNNHSKLIIDKVEEKSKDKAFKIASVSISYHNAVLNKIFKDMVESGSVEVLCEN